MRIEPRGVEALISWYAYGLGGLALLTIVSPLIVFSAPIVVLVGPPAVAWRRGRGKRPRLQRVMRWWLTVVAAVVCIVPLIAGVSFIAGSDDGAPLESFWLLLVGLMLAPFPLAVVAYSKVIAASVVNDP